MFAAPFIGNSLVAALLREARELARPLPGRSELSGQELQQMRTYVNERNEGLKVAENGVLSTADVPSLRSILLP